MSIEINGYLRGQIELGLRRFVADLAAIEPAKRASGFGGCSRSAFDMAYELSVVIQDYALRLRGEPSSAPTGFSFEHAPEIFCELEHAVKSLEAAVNSFLAALDAQPERAMKLPLTGSKATPLGLATTVNRHLHYHDAQLNYIQTLLGDGDVHWP